MSAKPKFGLLPTLTDYFSHSNIIRYTGRPFSSIEEHDEALIKNWNDVVDQGDVVYLLGDIGFGRKSYIEACLYRLRGTIHLIKGNHDKKIVKGSLASRFASINDYLEVKVDDEEMDTKHTLVLFHYPIESWNKKYLGSWHLHGHSHNKTDNTNFKTRLDVGVDCHDYRPLSYEEVKTVMTRKAFGLETDL